MSAGIRIIVGQVTLDGELFSSECAGKIADALPIETSPNEWGDEFYFAIPVHMPLDDSATLSVKVGDIGYWPPGHALALFFGPTPMSAGSDPVPASEVNIVGRVTGDAKLLKKALGAKSIKISRI